MVVQADGERFKTLAKNVVIQGFVLRIRGRQGAFVKEKKGQSRPLTIIL
jgi:hypothetical protein